MPKMLKNCRIFLEAHPAVATVYYPGLASHPGHEIAQKTDVGI